MAIFGKKKTEEKKDATTVISGGVIIGPRVAEKSALLSDKSVYSFEVDRKANKYKVYKAIKDKYKVEPIKINITNLPAKRVFVRGKWGRKPGVKKAIVFLKKGEKIEFM
ncbi:MAG: 50S ribosomal protein L23 [bacterium]